MSRNRPAIHQLTDFMVDSLRAASVSARAAESMLRAGREDPSTKPQKSPQDLAAAITEWANRAVRRLSSPHLGRPGPRGLAEDLVDALADCRPRQVAWWTLPAALPLTVTGLASDLLLRGEAIARCIEPEKLPDFLAFMAKIWSDLPIYFSLQYGQALAHLEQRLDQRPSDTELRFAYAMTLLECGLFREAAEHFEDLTGLGVRRGHHWAMVARFRSGDPHAAVDHGLAGLDRDEEAAGRLWLHLAAEESGRLAEIPESRRLHVFSRNAETDLLLEEVSADLGFNKTSGGRGTAVFDVTGDGTLDVLIAGAHSGISLYLNEGDGRFRDASEGSGLDACVYAFGLAAGDYDNDGRTDLFVTGLGFFDGQGMLLRNRGDGTFEDVTQTAGLDLWGPGFTASWIDYDGDGWLDLYVVNNLGGLFDRKTPNRLFHNNRNGTFRDVTSEAGLVTPWPSLGHCWGDFTNDGLPDLFVSNFGRAQLFKNRGDGTFSDISRQAGVDQPAIGSVAMACDVDGDGWLDILQMTFSRTADALFTLENGHGPEGGSPPRLFRNRSDGTFEEAGESFGFDGCWGTMSANFGDLGNRGSLDLVLGNGDPSMDRLEPTVLYRRDRLGRFRDVTAAAGLPLAGKGHGVNMADLNGDGRLHLIVGHGGLYPGDLMRTTIHRPIDDVGHWLNLRLVGTRGHHHALGARLRLSAGELVQHSLVSPGSAFGCLPFEQHFGLGEAGRVDHLEIRWPGGQRQIVRDIPADRNVEIVEGEAGWRQRPSRRP